MSEATLIMDDVGVELSKIKLLNWLCPINYVYHQNNDDDDDGDDEDEDEINDVIDDISELNVGELLLDDVNVLASLSGDINLRDYEHVSNGIELSETSPFTAIY